MEFSGFGWRDAVLLAAALATIYLVVVLLGLAQLQWRRRKPVADDLMATEPAEPMTIDFAPDADAAAEPASEEASEEATPVEFMPLDFSTPEPPRSAFGAQLALTELEAEVRQLRADVTSLRQELAEVRAARRVSPLYADAAALAERGFDARGVAEECGISVAEAELVLAMSREEKDFDGEVDDGGSGQDADAGRSGQ